MKSKSCLSREACGAPYTVREGSLAHLSLCSHMLTMLCPFEESQAHHQHRLILTDVPQGGCKLVDIWFA